MNTIKNILFRFVLLCIGWFCFMPDIYAAHTFVLSEKNKIVLDVSNVVLDNSFDFNGEANGLQTIYADISMWRVRKYRS